MKVKEIIITALFLTIVSFIATAQTIQRSQYEVKQRVDFFRMNKMQRGEWDPGATKAEVDGSPYLKEEFVNGVIYTTAKTKFTDVPLRLNAFNDELEFKNENGEIQAIAAPEIIERVDYDGMQMVYVAYENNGKHEKGYFLIMEEGPVSLYCKPYISFEYPKEQAPYQDSKPAKFNRKPDSYYLKIGNDPAKAILSRKVLHTMFPDYNKELEAFIKKNKVKLNKPEKLSELVKYYNSL